jgi:hypothetical protein
MSDSTIVDMQLAMLEGRKKVALSLHHRIASIHP